LGKRPLKEEVVEDAAVAGVHGEPPCMKCAGVQGSDDGLLFTLILISHPPNTSTKSARPIANRKYGFFIALL
jgi:hypothetical protein